MYIADVCLYVHAYICAGNLRPLINDGYLKKNEKCHLEKHGWAFFANIKKKRGLFSKYLNKYPWRRRRRRPPGAAAPGGGGIFQNIWKTDPFNKIDGKKGPSIFF